VRGNSLATLTRARNELDVYIYCLRTRGGVNQSMLRGHDKCCQCGLEELCRSVAFEGCITRSQTYLKNAYRAAHARTVCCCCKAAWHGVNANQFKAMLQASLTDVWPVSAPQPDIQTSACHLRYRLVHLADGHMHTTEVNDRGCDMYMYMLHERDASRPLLCTPSRHCLVEAYSACNWLPKMGLNSRTNSTWRSGITPCSQHQMT
jgi:hypothetical protein